jgi:tRNA-dihydrouridine synthase
MKDVVKIPVIGNRDIRTPGDACAMVQVTGCDAVMIGRTAAANPWILKQIEQYCESLRPTLQKPQRVDTLSWVIQSVGQHAVQ